MIKFVDTHTHLFCEEFAQDRDAVVAHAVEVGVERLCLPCIDASSIEPIREMCTKYPGVCFPMAGLHPTDVKDDYITQLHSIHATLEQYNDYIAVGEVGLDFYWDTTYSNEQIDAFKKQISWAHEYKLPLVIHSRNAFNELYNVMKEYREYALTGVFHCFSGTADEAVKLLEFDGFMLGIGGVLTYKKSTLPAVLREVVPLERIVLETDSPYLAPVPYRGKRNESAYIPYVAEYIAQLYNVSVEHVAEITTYNAEKIFPKLNNYEN